MLQRGVYPYEYLDDWERLNEISLPEKEGFSSQLNIEDTTDRDCTFAKSVSKDFE